MVCQILQTRPAPGRRGATVKGSLLFGGVAAAAVAAAVYALWLQPAPTPRAPRADAQAVTMATPQVVRPAPVRPAPVPPPPEAVVPPMPPAPSVAKALSPPAPAPAPAPAVPRFDVVRVTPQGEAVIAGRASPGATVWVQRGAAPLGRTTADRHGEWVLLPDAPLGPGSHELSVVESRGEAAAPVPSEQMVVVVVPEPDEDVAGRPAAAPAEPLAVAVARDGSGPTLALQVPEPVPMPPAPPVPVVAEMPAAAAVPVPVGAAAPLPPGGVSVETMDYGTGGRVALGGRGKPGGSVQLYLDNVLVGRASTDRDGRWKLSPDRPVDPGVYTLRADQVGDGGKVTARVELPVQVSDVPPDLPEDRRVVVQPGNSLWRIAVRTYGDGYQFITIYRANRDQIRDPDLIYPGQIFALPN